MTHIHSVKAATLAGFFWLGLFATDPGATSFDCSKAEAPHERAICADPGLSEQDDNMASLYADALARSDDPEAFRRDQRGWLERVRECGSDADCISTAYTERMEALSGLTSISEVSEPPEEFESPSNPEQGAAPVAEGAPQPKAAKAGKAAPTSGPAKAESWKGMVLIGGLVVAGALAILLVALSFGLVAKLSRYSAERFGWPVFLNWWNLIHVAGFLVGGLLVLPAGLVGFAAGYAPFWLAMAVVNVWKTNLPVGLAVSVLQPFYVFTAYFAWAASRNKRKS